MIDQHGDCHCDWCNKKIDLDKMKSGEIGAIWLGKRPDHSFSQHLCEECRYEGASKFQKWKISWENEEGVKIDYAWFPEGENPADHIGALNNIAELDAHDTGCVVNFEQVEGTSEPSFTKHKITWEDNKVQFKSVVWIPRGINPSFYIGDIETQLEHNAKDHEVKVEEVVEE